MARTSWRHHIPVRTELGAGIKNVRACCRWGLRLSSRFDSSFRDDAIATRSVLARLRGAMTRTEPFSGCRGEEKYLHLFSMGSLRSLMIWRRTSVQWRCLAFRLPRTPTPSFGSCVVADDPAASAKGEEQAFLLLVKT